MKSGPVTKPLDNPALRVDTCAGFVRALKPYKEAIYTDLVDSADCGPFDGCCLLFANALQSVIGGEVVMLIRAGEIAEGTACGRADHAVVHLGGKLYDFDGPLVPHAFMKRFGRNEHVDIGSFRAPKEGDLPEAVRDPALEQRVAALLREALAPGLQALATAQQTQTLQRGQAAITFLADNAAEHDRPRKANSLAR